MLITAVVTTYKRPELAKNAILSLINQTYNAIEIIVIEDGSRSGIDNWITNNNFKEILYHNNNITQGLSACRNWGINNSRGSYIGFLDDDDEWKPEMINKMALRLMELPQSQTDITAAICCGIEIRKQKEIVAYGYQKNHGQLKNSIKSNGIFTLSSSSIYLKKALNKVGNFDQSLKSSIDHDIWMSLAKAQYSTIALNEPLCVTNISPRERLTTNPQYRLNSIELYLSKWLPTFKQWFGEEKAIEYSNQYYSNVATNLAATKLISGEFKFFMIIMKQVFKKHSNPIQNLKNLFASLIREIVFTKMSPQTIKMIRKLLRKPQNLT